MRCRHLALSSSPCGWLHDCRGALLEAASDLAATAPTRLPSTFRPNIRR